MPPLKTKSRLGLIQSLLEPIQKILSTLLSGPLGIVTSKQARAEITLLADAALVRQFPLARLIPPATRQQIIRAQLDLVLDQIIGNNDLPPASAGTGFEGFILTTDEASATVSETAVMRVLGPGWTVTPLPLDDYSFEAKSERAALSVPEAWQAAHELRQQPGIADAEPVFMVPMESEMPEAARVPLTVAFKANDPTNDREWSVKAIKAREAWALPLPDGGKARGEGIIVGHPDTGYTHHLENWSDDPVKNKILFKSGYDFWNNDADATDDLDSGLFCAIHAGFSCMPGHGTGTSSVIFSDEGSPIGSADFVTGIAPRVRLIPFRVAPTVVIWNQVHLANAIIRATDVGCHVLSISLGGAASSYLQSALQRAVANGVIVCCAAGNVFGASNTFPVVVWPAAYDEAIAVAASNAARKPWKGSSRGKQVDISAPGESVWHAIAQKGKPLRDVERGSGTSYAVAHVAGVAALWLAFHGRDKLIAKYGVSHLASVFRTILVTAGFTPPPVWDANLFGNGIIDAVKVLKAALPPATFSVTAAMRAQKPFDQLANLFDDVPRAALRKELSALLKTSEPMLSARLDDVGDELTFHFFSDAKAREDFRKRCKATEAPATARKTSTRRRSTGGEEDLLVAASPTLAARISKH